MKGKNPKQSDLSEELKRLSLRDAAKFSSYLFQQPLDLRKIDGEKLCEQLFHSDLDVDQRKRLVQFREQVKNLLSTLVLFVSSSVCI